MRGIVILTGIKRREFLQNTTECFQKRRTGIEEELRREKRERRWKLTKITRSRPMEWSKGRSGGIGGPLPSAGESLPLS